MVSPPFAFDLPTTLNAGAPPERRGIRRDHVRLLVLDKRTGRTVHSRFDRLGDHLRPGDLLVLNNSRTLPAVLQALGPDGTSVEVRLARRRSGADWLALLSAGHLLPGATLAFARGLTATLLAEGAPQPLTPIRFSREGAALLDTLYHIGEPVRYEYAAQPWDLDYYQTVYATVPGSIEMPSAGRAFTWELLLHLQRRGIAVAFLSLHAGLSYYGDRWRKDPLQAPEEYEIPPGTADAIRTARRGGGRVIAVGTTVVRALESAAERDGEVRDRYGCAEAYIREGYPLKIADGILTGWHEPEASHLDMLSAFANPSILQAAYREAVSERYLWHEFGDANLIV